jgi:hypothetical protein
LQQYEVGEGYKSIKTTYKKVLHSIKHVGTIALLNFTKMPCCDIIYFVFHFCSLHAKNGKQFMSGRRNTLSQNVRVHARTRTRTHTHTTYEIFAETRVNEEGPSYVPLNSLSVQRKSASEQNCSLQNTNMYSFLIPKEVLSDHSTLTYLKDRANRCIYKRVIHNILKLVLPSVNKCRSAQDFYSQYFDSNV